MKYVFHIKYFLLLLLLTGCAISNEFTESPRRNFDMLWQILDENYCFFDYKGIQWENVYDRYSPEITEEMDKARLYTVMANMLDELKDGHVNLITDIGISGYNGWHTAFPANYDEYLVSQYIGYQYYVIPEINGVLIQKVEVTPGQRVGYLYFGNFTENVSERDLNTTLDFFSDCVGLIVDVRDNGGGSITNSDRLAARFLEQETLCGYILHKTGKGHNDFSTPYPIYLTPSHQLLWKRPVVVLTNRSCYSATNNFVSKMGLLPNVTVVGDRTGGGSGLPFTSELPNGWAVRFSASPILDVNKEHTEFGIDPDFFVSQEEEDTKNGIDTLIKAAILELTGVEY